MLRRQFLQVVERPVPRLLDLAFERQGRPLRRRLRCRRPRQQHRDDERRGRAVKHRHRRYSVATMTSDALITAIAASPTLRPSSSTASLVIDEVITTPLPISIRTCAVVWPFCTATTLPLI